MSAPASAPPPVPATHWALLILCCTLAFAFNAWRLPLFDVDEGAFAQATLEMLQRGDWLMTWLNGEPRYDKPILTYWIQALSVMLLGAQELAFRLPSIAAGCAWVFVVHRFCREQFADAEAALFAAAALALALWVGLIGHAATADALLNLWLTLSLLDLWRWSQSRKPSTLLRVYFWIGLGTLTKGPIAIALPVLTGFAFFAVYGRWRDALRAAFAPLGWLAFLAVLAPWVIALSLRDGGDFLRHFLLEQNVGRYTSTMEGHGGKLWYYLLWLPLVLLPFTALLPQTLRLARGWRTDPFAGFMLIWFGLAFVLFSASATQLPHYILYGCTPLFLLFGRHYRTLPRAGWLLLPALLLALLIALLPWLLPLARPSAQRLYELGIIERALASFDPGYTLIAFAGLAALLTLLRLRRPGWQLLLAAALVQSVLVWGALMPLLARAQQQPVREAALRAVESGLPAVSYRTWLPSFSVYRGAVTPNRLPQPGELAFVRRDRADDLRAQFPDETLSTVYDSGGVALLLRPALQGSQ